MLKKLRILPSLYRELGLRWSAFRIAYAFRLRTGLIRLQMPQYKWSDRPLETWLRKPQQSADRVGLSASKSVHLHRAQVPVSRPSEIPPNIPWNPQTAIAEADRILNGELKYFAHEFHQTGFPPNWHQVPTTLQPPSPAAVSLITTAIKHWSQISDDSDIDIKFIWEPNRFAFIYTLVRAYAASHDEKYAEAFWQSILDWAQHNPPNTGPNWMDGQEIALRLMAWTFGYAQFSNSPSTTPQRSAQYTLFVAAQAERIYKNIDYAISTRSNHTISEAFGLWLVGLLFPELKPSEKYLSLGRALLEREAATQIFPDGSYSMYSLNYHRFILHIYLYAMRLGEIYHFPFSSQLQKSVAHSIDFLARLIDPQTGQMPVYGSNDGALVLPLNNCDFTDHRPLLQLGAYITKGELLFEPGPWDEDIFWLCGGESPSPCEASPHGTSGRRVRDEGETNFPYGGLYLLLNTNSKALIRCTDFRARPSHADQLHVDLWIHGHNIACDAGTYLYSGADRRWRNGLAHTSIHNTVTVDGKDQMTMVSRFTWTNWSKARVLRRTDNSWQGEHDSYKPVSHKRTVIALEADRWLVIDHLTEDNPHPYALHWLLCDGEYRIQKLASGYYGLWLLPEKADSRLFNPQLNIQMGLVEGRGNFSLLRADPNSTRGWRSRYYGHKEPAISVMLEADQRQVVFWTFFGFESDVFEVKGKIFKLNSKIIPLVEYV